MLTRGKLTKDGVKFYSLVCDHCQRRNEFGTRGEYSEEELLALIAKMGWTTERCRRCKDLVNL